jgi:protein TonB
MLERLIESSQRRPRARGQFAISVVAHLATLAVVATATRGIDAIVAVSRPAALPYVLGVAVPVGPPTDRDDATATPIANPVAPSFEAPISVIELDGFPTGRVPSGAAPGPPPPGLVPRVPVPGGVPMPRHSPVPTVIEVDEPVVPLHGPQPVYPARLRAAGIEGLVRLRFVVTATGTVDRTTVVVVRSSHSGLDTAAVRTVLRWRFRPARSSGVAVPQLVEQVIRFRLDR